MLASIAMFKDEHILELPCPMKAWIGAKHHKGEKSQEDIKDKNEVQDKEL